MAYYCIKCGEKIPNEAQFCPNCGNPVVRTDKDISSDDQPGPADTSGTMLNTGDLYGYFDLEKLPEGHVIVELLPLNGH